MMEKIDKDNYQAKGRTEEFILRASNLIEQDQRVQQDILYEQS